MLYRLTELKVDTTWPKSFLELDPTFFSSNQFLASVSALLNKSAESADEILHAPSEKISWDSNCQCVACFKIPGVNTTAKSSARCLN